jgi:pimeloyl-ACP methyl ester carboxylesterase
MAAAEERRIRLWQGRVETRVEITGDGPPLVFLHGPWGVRGDRDFLERLASGHRIYAPSHPGTTPKIPMRSISSTSGGTLSSITANCSTVSASRRRL